MSMEIDTPSGEKVIMDSPDNGWPHDQQTIRKHGLVKGRAYTVESTEIHGSYTSLYLVEFPGVRFNTVNFSNDLTLEQQPEQAQKR